MSRRVACAISEMLAFLTVIRGKGLSTRSECLVLSEEMVALVASRHRFKYLVEFGVVERPSHFQS